MDECINVVVTAAGKGARMKSSLPKVLHQIGRRSMLEHVLASIDGLKQKDKNVIVVTSHEIINNFADKMPKQDNLNYVIQEQRLGTADAVKIAVNSKFWNKKNKYTGIFYGDEPFISADTIEQMFQLRNEFDLIVLGFDCKDQTQPYGRLFTDRDLKTGESGELYQIKEYKDLMRGKPRLCNSGIMIGKSEIFEKLLPLIGNKNKANEYYLTDIVSLANMYGYYVGAYICDEQEAIGVNSMEELAHAEKIYQNILRRKHMSGGVKLIDNDNVFFSHDTKVGKDVVIEPNVFFGLNVKIGNNCRICAFSYLENIEIKDNNIIEPFATREKILKTQNNNNKQSIKRKQARK